MVPTGESENLSAASPLADNAPTDVEDRGLVARAHSGDRAALEALIRRHQRWIYNIAIRMLHHPGLAVLALSVGTAWAADSCPTPSRPARYHIVTRPDPRLCPSPTCGGYFVREVNKPSTCCADGSWQPECHASIVDVSALGLNDEDRVRFDQAFGLSHALARGALHLSTATATPADELVVDEAWMGQAQSTPSGVFWGLVGNGIVCVTEPCESIDARKLNLSGRVQRMAGVNLAASGASAEQIRAGRQALQSPPGILAAGRRHRVQGPAGTSFKLVASEFYLLLASAAPPEGQACSNASTSMCPSGQFCDFASCDPAGDGVCHVVPDACPTVYEPVCGCDGVTYSNDCERRQAMVARDHDGPCAP